MVKLDRKFCVSLLGTRIRQLLCFSKDSPRGCLISKWKRNPDRNRLHGSIHLKIHEINIVVYLAQISAHFIPDLTIDLGWKGEHLFGRGLFRTKSATPTCSLLEVTSPRKPNTATRLPFQNIKHLNCPNFNKASPTTTGRQSLAVFSLLLQQN